MKLSTFTSISVFAVALSLLFSVSSASNNGKKQTIDIPPVTPDHRGMYSGNTRIFFGGVEDRRLVDDPSYVGITQTGLTNHPTPVFLSEPVKEFFSRSIAGFIGNCGMATNDPEKASFKLYIELYDCSYSEMTFAASEYGMAQVVFVAKFQAHSGEKVLLVRAFHVDKRFDLTKYVPEILHEVLKQSAERLCASNAFLSFIEPDQRAVFEQNFPDPPDLEKWLKKSSRFLTADPIYSLKEPVDLSGYTNLCLSGISITDKRYSGSIQAAEREIKQTMYTQLIERLYKKFNVGTSEDNVKTGKTISLSCTIFEFTPYRGATQGVMIGLFGPVGFLAGHGRLDAVCTVKDSVTGDVLAEIPFKTSANMLSNECMFAEFSLSIATFLSRCKEDLPSASMEVSWAGG